MLRPTLTISLRIVACCVALALTTTAAEAQWVNHRTPGTPRLADGTPNLEAPVPRLADGRPDLQGLWTAPRTAIMPPAGVLQSWAAELMQTRHETLFRDRPAYRCLPNGPEANADWKAIIQTPAQIAILNDNQTYRRIFLDGRRLEDDPHRTWMGYSVGRWDGDTLVVESFGFNDKTWLNPHGLPHTDALRITERYTRTSVGRMEVALTIADPGAFTEPWTAHVPLDLRVDSEMLETVCETSSDGWVGTLADARATAVSVPPDVLARYVGVYSGMWGPIPRTVRVRLEDGVLRVNGIYDQEVELIPQSPVFFAGSDGLTYEFIGAEGGQATHVIERHVSGDYTLKREE